MNEIKIIFLFKEVMNHKICHKNIMLSITSKTHISQTENVFSFYLVNILYIEIWCFHYCRYHTHAISIGALLFINSSNHLKTLGDVYDYHSSTFDSENAINHKNLA